MLPNHQATHPSVQSNTHPEQPRSKAACTAAKGSRHLLAIGLFASSLILVESGCMRVATAPARAERREQAESAFGRLAELSPDQIARFLDQRMAAQLTLNDNQQIRVDAINLDHAHELHAIATSTDSIRTKVRALRKQNDDHEAELKEVLTAEQFTRFLAMKEEMRDALKQLQAEK